MQHQHRRAIERSLANVMHAQIVDHNISRLEWVVRQIGEALFGGAQDGWPAHATDSTQPPGCVSTMYVFWLTAPSAPWAVAT